MSETSTKSEEKRRTVFDAAGAVFAQYGFRRTSMADVAVAAGISRPALYLLFENKEDLFRQLATYRQNEAIDEAEVILNGKGAVGERLTEAILAYERILYEPIAASPHVEEFLDVNFSMAADDMKRGFDRLISALAGALEEADRKGEIDVDQSLAKPRAFVDLLMNSIGGQKKAATSVQDFRRRIKQVTSVFVSSLASGGSQ